MTILIDHLNLDRSEDPCYWYMWALDFSNTFRSLSKQQNKYFNKKTHNINKELPPPSNIVMWVIYSQAIELYMKTYLLAKKEEPLERLIDKRFFGHDLEKLRLRCSTLDLKFDNKELTWITQETRKYMNMDWKYLKYPPKMPPPNNMPRPRKGIQHLPAMYGEQIMITPLDLLEELIQPLVFIKD